MDGTKRRPQQKMPRMEDVARLARVSHQTVSRVLNASHAVGPELTQRVQEAIELLGYKRNPAARSLASRRSMNLGVISFGIALYGPSLTLFGIAEAAREVGYTTSLVTLADVREDTVRSAFRHLEEVLVDGVIVVGPGRGANDIIRRLVDNVPVVTFEPGVIDQPARISLDEVLGARLATRHLLELGHASVWHVSGPGGWLGSEARIAGWRQELAANRRVAHEVIEAENWSAEAGYQAGRRIAANREITAVFVANDQMALGVLHALHEARLRVPEDVSVVGFDDIPEASHFFPRLTTVRLDFYSVGLTCVAVLMGMLGAKSSTARALPSPELIIRSSTGGPGAAGRAGSGRRPKAVTDIPHNQRESLL
jgi:DNA-binding LacI/PurR family transcriptional regulator